MLLRGTIDPQSNCILPPNLCLLTKSLDHLLQSALTLHQLLTNLEVLGQLMWKWFPGQNFFWFYYPTIIPLYCRWWLRWWWWRWQWRWRLWWWCCTCLRASVSACRAAHSSLNLARTLTICSSSSRTIRIAEQFVNHIAWYCTDKLWE